MKDRIILHSDMNNCYASIECVMDPTLRGKPLIVCGSKAERHGIVLAKSQEAKACGIVTGEPVGKAHEKCPGLVEVQPHFSEYMKFSKQAREIYSRYTDLVEPYGLDECWLDVTGSTLLFGSGEEIAEKLRAEIREKLGITVSIGVSFNKIFAKAASDLKKPDAVTVVSRENYQARLWPLPTSDLWGVGSATAVKLSRLGISTIGDLAGADRDAMERALGKAGRALCSYAAGEDSSPVMPADWKEPIKSIGHGVTATRDLQNNEDVWLLIYHLAQDVGNRLYGAGLKASGIAISVCDSKMRYNEFQGRTGIPTANPLTLARAAYRLFTGQYSWKYPVRALTVRAICLSPQDEPLQLTLLRSAVLDERTERLFHTVEEIRKRYGSHAVTAASLYQDVAAPPESTVNRVMPGRAIRP